MTEDEMIDLVWNSDIVAEWSAKDETVSAKIANTDEGLVALYDIFTNLHAEMWEGSSDPDEMVEELEGILKDLYTYNSMDLDYLELQLGLLNAGFYSFEDIREPNNDEECVILITYCYYGGDSYGILRQDGKEDIMFFSCAEEAQDYIDENLSGGGRYYLNHNQYARDHYNVIPARKIFIN